MFNVLFLLDCYVINKLIFYFSDSYCLQKTSVSLSLTTVNSFRFYSFFHSAIRLFSCFSKSNFWLFIRVHFSSRLPLKTLPILQKILISSPSLYSRSKLILLFCSSCSYSIFNPWKFLIYFDDLWLCRINSHVLNSSFPHSHLF